MLKVLACATGQHDLRLLLIAISVCLFGCYTALSLLSRAWHQRGAQCTIWITLASLVGGTAVWAAHFIAMLAFRSGLPSDYDAPLVILSILVAIILIGSGWTFAVRFPAWGAIGGGLSGAGIGAMHFMGMAALRLPAHLSYNVAYVTVAVSLGVLLGAWSMVRFVAHQPTAKSLIQSASIFFAAVAILHFTSMAALVITPMPTIRVASVPTNWLAGIITLAILLIVVLAYAGAMMDYHLASRASAETSRLRKYIAELQETKQTLEHTTDELKAALHEADAAIEAKSKFLAAMSHELRTPLNAVIGFSEIMSKELFGPLGNERYQDYIRNIRTSGQHLLELINDVLDYSKLEADRLTLKEEIVELGVLLRESIDMMSATAEKSSHNLILQIAPDVPPVLVDQRRMRQILLNLLSNAIKFSDAGTSIHIIGTRNCDSIEISVSDKGIGIADEDIPKALELFGQVDTGFSRPYEGTGLGLPVAKRLIELHGGKLQIESTIGVGTTIRILLPLSRAEIIPAVA